jgi:hypothetical protein
MTAIIDLDRVALILVEAAFFGDKGTIKKWGITRQTVYNYRQLLNTNSDLLHKFTLKKREFESNWANEIPASIIAGINFLGQAAKEADPKNPDTIHAIAGAVKILAEVGLAKEIIDARLGREFRQSREEDNALVASSDSNISAGSYSIS